MQYIKRHNVSPSSDIAEKLSYDLKYAGVTGVYSGMVINYSFVIITDSCKEFSLI
jgi:hypothetical protein